MTKAGKNRRTWVWVITGATLVAAAASAVLYFGRVARYQEKVRELTYSEVEIAGVADGVYVGACNADFVAAKVQVTVMDGAITRIEILEHKQERGKAGEAVVQAMIDEQRIDVDAVSGATNSSKVIKKAVESALAQ